MIKNSILTLATAVVIMLLSSCSGIFDGIYDEPASSGKSEFGFVIEQTNSEAGTIYINATDYTRWTYMTFETMAFDTLTVDQPEPAHWDIAIHRYDAKTNGGAVVETEASSFEDLVIPEDGYTSDVFTTNVIITDMSHMMDGYLSYVDSDYNEVLSRWLNVDTSSMPPIYTMSGKVYVVRLASGKKVAIKLENFMNGSGIKGYMTIKYKLL